MSSAWREQGCKRLAWVREDSQHMFQQMFLLLVGQAADGLPEMDRLLAEGLPKAVEQFVGSLRTLACTRFRFCFVLL